MDFFEHQTRARTRTRLLVLYFLLALVLIVAAINLASWGIAGLTGALRPDEPGWWERPWWLWVTTGTTLLILLGSLWRMGQLAGGGRAVAKMVGAVPVENGNGDPARRRLVNIAEEMAIASGVRLPALYVLERETGINAFVAGSAPNQAVLVVTRGALDQLDRDQMQGVVAHEFSHLFYGDVRLNTRLIGVLAGILLLGQAGLFLLRSLRYTGSSRSRGGGQGLAALLAGGLALTVIGYIGLFFGRLIQAAVSRQREFLADASSVQYTRNPAGLAGALARIGQISEGSRLHSRFAEDMAHLCFGETRPVQLFSGLLASHPPLTERIRRIAPGFRLKTEARPPEPKPTAAPPKAASAASAVTASIGQPTGAHLAFAAALAASIPEPVRQGLHSPRSVKGVIYALLLAESPAELESKGLELLRHGEGHDLANLAARLLPDLRRAGARLRLPLLDLALPTLERLPPAARQTFLTQVDELVQLDGRQSLFEYLLRLLLHRQLAAGAQKPPRVRFATLAAVRDDAVLLLSLLAHAGGPGGEEAFGRLLPALFTPAPTLLPLADCRLGALHQGLKRLAQLTPEAKRQLVEAMAGMIVADDEVRPEEAEVLRAACAMLEVPLPPLLPEEKESA